MLSRKVATASKKSLPPEPMTTVSGSMPSPHSALPALSIIHQTAKHDGLTDPTKVSVDGFCEIKAIEQTGVHVYYLPSVGEVLLSDGPSPYPAASAKMRKHLTEEFHIPSWFWERQGWDANGFFASRENPIADIVTSHCSLARFLIKEVDEQVSSQTTNPEYHWRFLAFATLWFEKHDTGEATLILLCFDLQENPAPPPPKESLYTAFSKHLNKISRKEIISCPYSVYVPLLDVVVSQYNRAVWTFRKPVRNIEKELNEDMTNDLFPKPRQSRRNESFDDIEADRREKVERYGGMHDLSRHIIHASETLKVAVRTVGDIVRDSDHCSRACCSTSKDKAPDRKSSKFNASLRSHDSFLQNLNERTNAFYERIQNQKTLAYHLLDVDDTTSTRHILRETSHDGRDLTSAVSVLSVLFLPPAFTASFFGMNFPFGFGSMRPIWMWAVSTVFLWIAAFFALTYAIKRRRKDLEKPARPPVAFLPK